MKLKQFIQRLLNSRTTPAEAVTATGLYFEIPVAVYNNVTNQDIIAPCDGYARVFGTVQSDGYIVVGLRKNDSPLTELCASSTVDNVESVLTRVNKGDLIKGRFYNLKNCAVLFFSALGNKTIVGGGVIRLLNALCYKEVKYA